MRIQSSWCFSLIKKLLVDALLAFVISRFVCFSHQRESDREEKNEMSNFTKNKSPRDEKIIFSFNSINTATSNRNCLEAKSQEKKIEKFTFLFAKRKISTENN